MGTRSRLTLLMLTAILGKGAPMRPPGGPSGVPESGPSTAPCPRDREPCDIRSGNLYWCEDHRIWFDLDGNVYNETGS
jgi:hypothetical protein